MFVYNSKYVDYNGVERREDYYFNLTESELIEAEYDKEGSLSSILTNIVKTNDQGALIRMFKYLILKSYGEKSIDGKRFVKSEELSTQFSQTEAFNMMYMKCVTDDQFANKFIENIIPKAVTERAKNDPEAIKQIEAMKKDLGIAELPSGE